MHADGFTHGNGAFTLNGQIKTATLLSLPFDIEFRPKVLMWRRKAEKLWMTLCSLTEQAVILSRWCSSRKKHNHNQLRKVTSCSVWQTFHFRPTTSAAPALSKVSPAEVRAPKFQAKPAINGLIGFNIAKKYAHWWLDFSAWISRSALHWIVSTRRSNLAAQISKKRPRQIKKNQKLLLLI